MNKTKGFLFEISNTDKPLTEGIKQKERHTLLIRGVRGNKRLYRFSNNQRATWESGY